MPRFAMSNAGRSLLLLFCLLPLNACAQEHTVQVEGIPFVTETVSVPVGQKEAAAGDLTGDEHPDVLLAVNDSVSILQGDAMGSLSYQTQTPAGPNPTGPALADLDNDDILDVAVANHETTHLTLLRGTGAGGLEAFAQSPLTIDVAPHPHAVRVADLDNDGHADLIVDHRGGEGLLILRGRGNGTFASPGTVVKVGGDPYRGMAVGDLNGDGAPDLVTPNPNAVGVLLSDKSEQLAFSQSTIATEASPFAVELADLSGDGQLDVIAALDEGSSLVQVFLGAGAGDFREAENSPVRFAEGAKMIARGDFNGDDVDDAAITCWNAPNVLLLLGGTDSIQTTTLPMTGNAWGPAAADINGDGVDDLIIPDASSDRAVTFVSQME